jgi:UDP-N-acetylglucosamine diphosphorylase/glucosamine-1-phosphate N-acetyltransferase
VPGGVQWEPGAEFDAVVDVEGLVLAGAFDLVTALEHFLVADAADFTTEPGDALPEGSTVVGDPGDVVILGATIEPGVVFDVRHGAVVVEQHSYVRSGTRLDGPVFVGPGCEILGGPVSACAFGPRCKVRGEISSSVFLGYSNKGHEGFVGHSVVGRWANLGAGTTTSNLKNTYGPVRLDLAGERVETGRQFLGTLFGDHAKVAIGTQFNTGTIVGVGANVFGTGRPPKFVPPFAWGDAGVCSLDGFLAIAERVLPRRNVTVTDQVRATLERIYQHATSA